MSNERSKSKSILLISGIVVLSYMVVYALEGFFPLGSGSVVALDLSNQYMPLLYRFYDVVINGKNVAVDLNLGGGINIYSDTITELINPFNYFLLLFPREKLYLGVNLLVVLYALAASNSAFLVLEKLNPVLDRKADFGRLINMGLAIAYGMSYYIAYQYEIIRWMYPVVLFPVFFLALSSLLEGRKRYPFILLLAYELVLSFQFGVQLCLFTFLYAACYLWVGRKNTGSKDLESKDSGRTILNLGVGVFTALLLSAFSTVPFVINLLGSERTSQNNSVFTVVMHHGLDNILERIFEISSPVVLGVFLFALMVLKKGIREFFKTNKALCLTYLILIITVILEPSNLLWHLGSYQCFPVRYGFIVLFLGILISCKLLQNVVEISGFERASLTRKRAFSEKVIPLEKAMPLLALIPVFVGTVYVYLNRLSFAQAFATLDVSNVCLRETLILYGIMLLMTAAVEWCLFTCVFKNDTCVSLIMYIIVSVAVGIIWNLAIFLPQTSDARRYNEAVYELMNERASYVETEVYSGHVEDRENYPLNAPLITGENSMSAYIPSGEGMEYSRAMAKMEFETPWITVSSRGGNADARYFLGIGNGLKGGILLPKANADSIKDEAEMAELAYTGNEVPIIFEHNRGKVKVDLSGYSVADGDYAILLPMAYIHGWNCTDAEVSSYLGGFLRLDLNSGIESLEIDFTPPGLWTGVIISVFGIALLLLLGVFFNPKGKVIEKAASIIFTVAAVLLIICIYILPNLGMVAFMGAKAFGKDFSSFVQSIGSGEEATNDQNHTDVLLSTEWEEKGLRVYVGHNNLMTSKKVKVTASDMESSDFKPELINDGDVTSASRWSSANDWENNEHFLQVDLKNEKYINAVKIYWERTNVTDYALEISDNGIIWTEVIRNQTAPKSNPETIFLGNPVEARYLRIHSYDVAKNEEDLTLYYQNVSINELQVFEAPCDSFLIETPAIEPGSERNIPVPEVPSGYVLTPGGMDYDNLLSGVTLADTLADVSAEIGYTLSYGQESWDLPGFEVIIPSSTGENDVFPYETVEVKEFASGVGTVSALDNDIQFTTGESSLNFLGDEGYEIRIKDDGSIEIISKDEKGKRWALNTLDRMKMENPKEYPVGTIRDYPKYAVRGFVIDVARTPVSMDLLYRIVTLMSENYMNTLQVHLNDNAIIASSDYDGTMEGAKNLYSAFRLESGIKNKNGESLTASDGYYSKEEFKKFIEDAKEMGVDVVPEIDTPAHSLAITRLFPEFGMNEDPEMADTLDISRAETISFVSDLWMEYLTGDGLVNTEGATFENCNALSIGMDEFYGDYEEYAVYITVLSGNIKAIAPDKKLRLWGSMDYKEMYKGAIDPDTEIMIWNMFWADPIKTYDEGFSIINCLSQDLYIIVGGGYDYLDNDYLAEEWEPNRFVDGALSEEIPAWSPKMLGACYSMWNDHNLGPQEATFEEGLFDRILQPIDILSKKLWN